MSEQLTGYKELFEKANEFKALAIKERIIQLQNIYGSCRALGKALNIDHAYLARLRDGEKTQPSSTVLRKLGLD